VLPTETMMAWAEDQRRGVKSFDPLRNAPAGHLTPLIRSSASAQPVVPRNRAAVADLAFLAQLTCALTGTHAAALAA